MFPAGTFSGERQTRSRFFLPPGPPCFFTQKGRAGWVVPDYRSVRRLGWFCACILLRHFPAGRTSAGRWLSARSRRITPATFAGVRQAIARRTIHLPLRARRATPRLASDPALWRNVGIGCRPADLALWCKGGVSRPTGVALRRRGTVFVVLMVFPIPTFCFPFLTHSP